LRSEGKLVRKSGPDNPQWMGGPKAYLARLPKSVIYERTKAYRKANPEKVREFTQRRHGRKYGKLPRGTVAGLLKLQRGKCAICATVLSKYHVDHVMPLAKGGKHERLNIQLLCPTCNVRKAAKDPIQYMQELGRLL
jgi:5-methylcytosine-specific restriction endonuclease McrA